MSLKLVQKAFLLIAIPLGLVLIFLWALAVNLEQAEKDTAMEMRAGAALMYVNSVLWDALNTVGGTIMYRSTKDPRFLKDIAQNAASFQEHREELQKIAKANPNDQSNLQQFVSLVDQFQILSSEVQNLYDGSGYLSSITAAAKMRNHVRQVNVIGNN